MRQLRLWDLRLDMGGIRSAVLEVVEGVRDAVSGTEGAHLSVRMTLTNGLLR